VFDADDVGARSALLRRAVLRRHCAARLSDYNQRVDPAQIATAARTNPAPPEVLSPPAGYFLVATLDGEPVGCGGRKIVDRAVGEIKRMWVAPAVRGLGVGRRILESLEAHALRAHLQILRLETNETLEEAHALYRRSGYRETAPFNTEPYAQLWFAKDLDAS